MPSRDNIRNDLDAIDRLSVTEAVDGRETLTLTEFCVRMNRDREWVYENLVHVPDGLPVLRRGRFVLISGHVFNEWVAARCEAQAPARKKASTRKAVRS